MAHRVFVIAAEYAAPPHGLDFGVQDALREYRTYPNDGSTWQEQMTRLFFRSPRSRADWAGLGRSEPVDLSELLASASHRALCTLHEILGQGDYGKTLRLVTDLWATTMPGIAAHQVISPALIPQMLRAQLRLSFDSRCQFVVGTSDSGAWAFANAVRAARRTKATVLLTAGQMIPPGYAAVNAIRSVLGKADQAAGLDMLAVGDFLMDNLRRTQSGMTREAVIEALDAVRASKYARGERYPAAMMSGLDPTVGPRVTPFYRVRDIAPACCGAAAVILTSDERLVARVAKGSSDRFQVAPIVEVLGVGEGTSNPTVVNRRSPLTFGSPVIQSLTSAAEDATLPLDTFTDCSFAILHDAFPSIELMFLLGIGLSVEEALERMQTSWPNPWGGLCVFGHALGASGLVQICKAAHIFTGDRRYAKAKPEVEAGPGDLAFTTSVGGPLSHIVVSIFKGGTQELDARRTLSLQMNRPNLVADQQERRRAVRDAAAEYRIHLAQGTPLRYVEGVTTVDLRSCIKVVTREQLLLLELPAITALLKPEHAAKAREDLVVRLSLLGQDVAAGNANVVSDYGEAVRDLVARWKDTGQLRDEHLQGDPEEVIERLTRTVKAGLRVPVALTAIRPRGRRRSQAAREVKVLPELAAYAEADFVRDHGPGVAPADAEPRILPWWHIRAETEDVG